MNQQLTIMRNALSSKQACPSLFKSGMSAVAILLYSSQKLEEKLTCCRAYECCLKRHSVVGGNSVIEIQLHEVILLVLNERRRLLITWDMYQLFLSFDVLCLEL
ncbi:hypothetical protein RchiOBHm_Chr5g0046901 [Rosa chinensis]|uniref:Uncharacterized protein n=1 Tax=Rosa chinensis TaxID=74649 RepID=A0A2P6QEB1_ROSCH|nr:hypothetical protein RchiOBHm_Chr5g0046901 [Rosa chinensis]